jgi:RNA polymerase sigma-70 factor (ECF subfamily)
MRPEIKPAGLERTKQQTAPPRPLPATKQVNFDPGEDRYIRGINRRKARQLIDRFGFTKHDCEDIEQDLFVHVLKRLPHFRPERAHRNKFITAVVERKVANILRNKRAAKRDHRRIRSLNVRIELTGEGAAELADMTSQRDVDARLQRESRAETDLAQLKMDLQDAIATLPEELQMLAGLCMTHTMSEIARMTGVPRTTLNGRMQSIRKRFEKTSLRDYLDVKSSTWARTG